MVCMGLFLSLIFFQENTFDKGTLQNIIQNVIC